MQQRRRFSLAFKIGMVNKVRYVFKFCFHCRLQLGGNKTIHGIRSDDDELSRVNIKTLYAWMRNERLLDIPPEARLLQMRSGSPGSGMELTPPEKLFLKKVNKLNRNNYYCIIIRNCIQYRRVYPNGGNRQSFEMEIQCCSVYFQQIFRWRNLNARRNFPRGWS